MKIRLVIWILILCYANQCFASEAHLILNLSTGQYYWSFEPLQGGEIVESTMGGPQASPTQETLDIMNQVCEEINRIIEGGLNLTSYGNYVRALNSLSAPVEDAGMSVELEEFLDTFFAGLGLSRLSMISATVAHSIDSHNKDEKEENKPTDPENTPVDEKVIEEKDFSEVMNAPTETVLHPLSFIKYLPLWLALYNHLGLAIMGTYLLTHTYKIYKEERYMHSEEYELDRLNKISEYYWGKSVNE